MNAIESLIQAKNITSQVEYVGVRNSDGWQHHEWNTWLYVDGSKVCVYECTYSKGMAYSYDDAPSPLEIIVSMHHAGEMSGSFEEWCSEFGYDEDSRKAYAIWEECVKAGAVYAQVFTPEERKAIAECINEEGL